VRKFGILLVSVTGLMALGGVANADTSVPDTQISQVLWGAGSVADTTSAQTATQPATTVADPRSSRRFDHRHPGRRDVQHG